METKFHQYISSKLADFSESHNIDWSADYCEESMTVFIRVDMVSRNTRRALDNFETNLIIEVENAFPFEAILFVEPEDEIPVYDTFYIHKNLKP